MNYCPECGKKLTKLHTWSSWCGRWLCECGMRIQIIYGDTMGGSHDEITTNRTPFDREVPVE